MFGGMRFSSRRLDSHAEALAYYNSMKPWRGETADGDERPLRNRRYRNTGVRKLADGSVVFRLHQTDVVTYRSDGSVVLRIYDSMTTAEFIHAHAPSHISASLSGYSVGHVRVAGNFYRACGGDVLTIRGSGVTGARPWIWPRVNRKAANAFRRETGLDKVRQWLRAAQAMGFPVYDRKWLGQVDVAGIIADPARWPELLKLGGIKAVAHYEHNHMRAHCLTVAEYAYLCDWRDVYACRAACRTWGY
jgi:hypothetical protein